MTISGDFIPADGDDFEAESSYPVVFGIELTPMVIGIVAAVVGVGLAFYLFNRFVQPERQRNQELATDIAAKEQQLATQEQQLQEIARLEEELELALQQRRNIYGLFADEESMDTLLLDINQRIQNSNAALGAVRNQIRSRGIPPILVEAQLENYDPQGENVITDGSLGDGVNGVLKRQTYNIQFSGDFAQTQAILSNIERLEPLLLIRNFQVSSGEPVVETVIGSGGQVVGQPKAKIATSFQVDALIPTGDPAVPPEITLPPAEGEAADGEAAEEAPAE
ncbi:MAG: hypothetical protein AAFZ80_03390 [Cyanobacteria bacterium P01_A01_bin.105]